MKFHQFVNVTHSWWSSHFKKVAQHQQEGTLIKRRPIEYSGGVEIILYPNIILVSEIGGLYVAELIGASEFYQGLTLKRHKEDSLNRYLNQFEDSGEKQNPSMTISGTSRVEVLDVCLAQGGDITSLRHRFPYLELYPTILSWGDGSGGPIVFQDDFTGHFTMINGVLINHSGSLFRSKNISSLFIVPNTTTEGYLLSNVFEAANKESIRGIQVVETDKAKLLVAGQLQSMYLFPGLRETTIGEFIKRHPDIVHKAFKTDYFEYEPSFEWLEHDGTCTDRFINPDLMIKRADGLFDIYDLKKALLTKDSITRGERSRRTFIAEVEDGLAQLANYAEYFTYKSNIDYAFSKYGVEVSNPRLVLIIGSFDNVNIIEVNQACRKYRTEISVIDYDTFCNMFLAAS
ncbi:Shedu anti-phage system protein SduA domain-containing protein [uncultured Hymenobacter sp.]|uniref:Shedu anti-phage system protein SduA domain-containing protein n=1 Tax=uncultured Hymenobacter sp. TaxID=170016 RepID=UPI0035CB5586